VLSLTGGTSVFTTEAQRPQRHGGKREAGSLFLADAILTEAAPLVAVFDEWVFRLPAAEAFDFSSRLGTHTLRY
jgi:hypothetical protein